MSDTNRQQQQGKDNTKLTFGFSKTFGKSKIVAKAPLSSALRDDEIDQDAPSSSKKHYITGVNQSVTAALNTRDDRSVKTVVSVKPQSDRDEPLPEPLSVDSYTIAPDEFGLALLRGSGYEPGKPIGGRNRQFVEPRKKKPLKDPIRHQSSDSSTHDQPRSDSNRRSRSPPVDGDIFVKESARDSSRSSNDNKKS